MTAPITLPAAPRMTGSNPRMAAKAEEGGESEGFKGILDDCGAAGTVDLDGIAEDGDTAAADGTSPEKPVGVELTPLLSLQQSITPPQVAPAAQPGTQAVMTAPVLLAITALQACKTEDPEMPRSGDLRTATTAGPADDPVALQDGTKISNLTVLASAEGDEAIMTDRKNSAPEGLETRRDEQPPTLSPAARSPDQGAVMPPPPASPAEQILTRIAEFTATAEGRAHEAQNASLSAASKPPLAQGSSVKTLRIRLEPESLGEVEVTLRQTAAGVRVEIQVAQSTTAETLARDLSLLEDKLSGLLGTSAATAAISISLQAGGPLDTRPTSGTSQGFPQAGPEAGAGGGGAAGQRESRPEAYEAPVKLNRTGQDEEDTAIRSSARTGRVV